MSHVSKSVVYLGSTGPPYNKREILKNASHFAPHAAAPRWCGGAGVPAASSYAGRRLKSGRLAGFGSYGAGDDQVSLWTGNMARRQSPRQPDAPGDSIRRLWEIRYRVAGWGGRRRRTQLPDAEAEREATRIFALADDVADDRGPRLLEPSPTDSSIKTLVDEEADLDQEFEEGEEEIKEEISQEMMEEEERTGGKNVEEEEVEEEVEEETEEGEEGDEEGKDEEERRILEKEGKLEEEEEDGEIKEKTKVKEKNGREDAEEGVDFPFSGEKREDKRDSSSKEADRHRDVDQRRSGGKEAQLEEAIRGVLGEKGREKDATRDSSGLDAGDEAAGAATLKEDVAGAEVEKLVEPESATDSQLKRESGGATTKSGRRGAKKKRESGGRGRGSGSDQIEDVASLTDAPSGERSSGSLTRRETFDSLNSESETKFDRRFERESWRSSFGAYRGKTIWSEATVYGFDDFDIDDDVDKETTKRAPSRRPHRGVKFGESTKASTKASTKSSTRGQRHASEKRVSVKVNEGNENQNFGVADFSWSGGDRGRSSNVGVALFPKSRNEVLDSTKIRSRLSKAPHWRPSIFSESREVEHAASDAWIFSRRSATFATRQSSDDSARGDAKNNAALLRKSVEGDLRQNRNLKNRHFSCRSKGEKNTCRQSWRL